MSEPAKTLDEKVRIVSREIVFEDFHKLERVVLQPRSLKDGSWYREMKREVFFGSRASLVLMYCPETDEIALSEQFRTGPYFAGFEQPWLLEAAGGIIDPGETPEQTAIREAKEETGCDVLDIEFIGSFFSSPGCFTERIYLHCGRIAAQEPGEVYGKEEEGEEIKIHMFPADEVIDMLDRGDLHHGTTALCVQWFARNKDRLRKHWLGEDA